MLQPRPALRLLLLLLVLLAWDRGSCSDVGSIRQTRDAAADVVLAAATFVREGTTTEFATGRLGRGRSQVVATSSSRVSFDRPMRPLMLVFPTTVLPPPPQLQLASQVPSVVEATPVLGPYEPPPDPRRVSTVGVLDRYRLSSEAVKERDRGGDFLLLDGDEERNAADFGGAQVVDNLINKSTERFRPKTSTINDPFRKRNIDQQREVESQRQDTVNPDNVATVRPINDLPTYTVRHDFSPSGFSQSGDDVDDLSSPDYGDAEVPQQPKKDYLSSFRSGKAIFRGGRPDPPRLSKLRETVTYTGFADFTTTIGDTVVVFTPSTVKKQPAGAQTTRSITSAAGDATVPEPGVVTKLKTFMSHSPGMVTRTVTGHSITTQTTLPTMVVLPETFASRRQKAQNQDLSSSVYVVEAAAPEPPTTPPPPTTNAPITHREIVSLERETTTPSPVQETTPNEEAKLEVLSREQDIFDTPTTSSITAVTSVVIDYEDYDQSKYVTSDVIQPSVVDVGSATVTTDAAGIIKPSSVEHDGSDEAIEPYPVITETPELHLHATEVVTEAPTAPEHKEEEEYPEIEEQTHATEFKVTPTPPLTSYRTATTQLFDHGDEEYPLGLIKAIAGTEIINDTTTLFTSLIHGSSVNGHYAQIIHSASSIFYFEGDTKVIVPPKSVITPTSTVNLQSSDTAAVSQLKYSGSDSNDADITTPATTITAEQSGLTEDSGTTTGDDGNTLSTLPQESTTLSDGELSNEVETGRKISGTTKEQVVIDNVSDKEFPDTISSQATTPKAETESAQVVHSASENTVAASEGRATEKLVTEIAASTIYETFTHLTTYFIPIDGGVTTSVKTNEVVTSEIILATKVVSLGAANVEATKVPVIKSTARTQEEAERETLVRAIPNSQSESAAVHDGETPVVPSTDDEAQTLVTQIVASTIYETFTHLTTYFIPVDGGVTTSVKTNEVVTSDVILATQVVPVGEVKVEATTVPAVTSTLIPQVKVVNDQPTLPSSQAQSTPESTEKTEKEQGEDGPTSTPEGRSQVILEPTTTSSTADEEEEGELELLVKSVFTTYTYLTTFFQESTTTVASNIEVVTNVITETVDKDYFRRVTDPAVAGLLARTDNVVEQTPEIAPTSVGVGRPTTKFFPDEDLFSAVVDSVDIEREMATEATPALNEDVIKTFYTTYTYFTTIFVDGETTVSSRTEVYTNIVTPTGLLEATPVISSAGQTISSTQLLEPDDIADDRLRNQPLLKNAPRRQYLYSSTISRDHNQLRSSLNEVDGSGSAPTAINDFFDDIENSIIVPAKSKVGSVAGIKNVYATITRPPAIFATSEPELTSSVVETLISSSSGERTLISPPERHNALPFPPLLDDQISSESNTESLEPSPTLLLQTSYTTYTYFTTVYKGLSTEVKSRLETVTNVVTETLTPQRTALLTDDLSSTEDDPYQPTTYFTTFTYWTTLFKDGTSTVTSREETISEVVTPTLERPAATNTEIVPTVTPEINPTVIPITDHINPSEVVYEPTTYFTTFTYLTTSYIGNSTVVNSRLHTVTEVVNGTVPAGEVAGVFAGRAVATSAKAQELEKTVPTVKPAVPALVEETLASKPLLAPSLVQLPTGLISTVVSSTIDAEGTTTLFSTNVSGIFLDGTYAQVLKSTMQIIPPTLSSESQTVQPTSTPKLPVGVISLNKGRIVDADGISTTFFTTEAIGTYVNGQYSQVVESTSSVKVNEERRSALQLALAPSPTVEINGKTYRTGLVRLIDGTVTKDGTTTFYESKITGTVYDGKYAQIISSKSSFKVDVPSTTAPPISAVFPTATTDATTVTPTAAVAATTAPTPAVVESSLGSDEVTPSTTPQSSSEQQDDDSNENESDSDGGKLIFGKGSGSGRNRTRLTYPSKKKTFTPTIRPFGTQGATRPPYRPQNKRPATVTRTVVTPTITATPAAAAKAAGGTGRFSGSRRGALASSSAVNEIRPTASGGRRFSRPRGSSSAPTGQASSYAGGGRTRSSSRAGAIVPTAVGGPQGSSRRGLYFRGSSALPGRSSSVAGGYFGSTSRYRGRVNPTSTIVRGGATAGYIPATTPSDETLETDDFITTLVTEETPQFTDNDGPFETQPLPSTTESVRRNPLLNRLRRPPLVRASTTTTPRSPTSSTSPARSTSATRRTSNRPIGSSSSTTTSRPRTRAPLSYQPAINRPRPGNSLFPPRGLFKRPGQEEEPQQPEEQNNEEETQEEAQDEDEVQEEGGDEVEDEEDLRDNDYEGSEHKESKKAAPPRNKAGGLPYKPVQIRPFSFRRRTKRQVDKPNVATRSYTSRFRRPGARGAQLQQQQQEEPVTPEPPPPPTSQQKSKSNGGRYTGRGRTQNQQQQHQQQAPQGRIKPSPPTTSAGRAQFTLREKDTSGGNTRYRRPQAVDTSTATADRRTSKGNRRRGGTRADETTSSIPARPKPPRLRTTSNSNSKQAETSYSSQRNTRRNNGNTNTRRNNGGRTRFSKDPDLDKFTFALPTFDGTITVTHHIPEEATIPVVNGKMTEYRNVLTARHSMEVLNPNQYVTSTAKDGNTILFLTSEVTAALAGGATEITQFYLRETPTTSVIFTPTTIRGRLTSYSHIIPSTVYDVESTVSTIQPAIAANAPLANLLLSQLLLGNLGGGLPGGINPLLALQNQPPAPPPTPTTEYKTRTSTYVTTLTTGKSTVLPITLRGKKIYTTIVDQSEEVITATEFFTDTVVVTPTPTAVNNQLNSLLIPALLQAQLLGPTGPMQSPPQPNILASLGQTDFLPTGKGLLFQEPDNAEVPPDLVQSSEQRNKGSRRRQQQRNDDTDRLARESEADETVPYDDDVQQQGTQPHDDEVVRTWKPPRKKTRNGNNSKPPDPAPPVETSVVTLYVSGRRPGEFSTVVSTVTGDSSIRKREIRIVPKMEPSRLPQIGSSFGSDEDDNDIPTKFNHLDNYVMSAMDELGVLQSSEVETQSLESIVGDVSKYLSVGLTTTMPRRTSYTTRPFMNTKGVSDGLSSSMVNNKNSTGHFLSEGPAEIAPLKRKVVGDYIRGNDKNKNEESNYFSLGLAPKTGDDSFSGIAEVLAENITTPHSKQLLSRRKRNPDVADEQQDSLTSKAPVYRGRTRVVRLRRPINRTPVFDEHQNFTRKKGEVLHLSEAQQTDHVTEMNLATPAIKHRQKYINLGDYGLRTIKIVRKPSNDSGAEPQRKRVIVARRKKVGRAFEDEGNSPPEEIHSVPKSRYVEAIRHLSEDDEEDDAPPVTVQEIPASIASHEIKPTKSTTRRRVIVTKKRPLPSHHTHQNQTSTHVVNLEQLATASAPLPIPTLSSTHRRRIVVTRRRPVASKSDAVQEEPIKPTSVLIPSSSTKAFTYSTLTRQNKPVLKDEDGIFKDGYRPVNDAGLHSSLEEDYDEPIESSKEKELQFDNSNDKATVPMRKTTTPRQEGVSYTRDPFRFYNYGRTTVISTTEKAFNVLSPKIQGASNTRDIFQFTQYNRPTTQEVIRKKNDQTTTDNIISSTRSQEISQVLSNDENSSSLSERANTPHNEYDSDIYEGSKELSTISEKPQTTDNTTPQSLLPDIKGKKINEDVSYEYDEEGEEDDESNAGVTNSWEHVISEVPPNSDDGSEESGGNVYAHNSREESTVGASASEATASSTRKTFFDDGTTVLNRKSLQTTEESVRMLNNMATSPVSSPIESELGLTTQDNEIETGSPVSASETKLNRDEDDRVTTTEYIDKVTAVTKQATETSSIGNGSSERSPSDTDVSTETASPIYGENGVDKDDASVMALATTPLPDDALVSPSSGDDSNTTITTTETPTTTESSTFDGPRFIRPTRFSITRRPTKTRLGFPGQRRRTSSTLPVATPATTTTRAIEATSQRTGRPPTTGYRYRKTSATKSGFGRPTVTRARGNRFGTTITPTSSDANIDSEPTISVEVATNTVQADLEPTNVGVGLVEQTLVAKAPESPEIPSLADKTITPSQVMSLEGEPSVVRDEDARVTVGQLDVAVLATYAGEVEIATKPVVEASTMTEVDQQQVVTATPVLPLRAVTSVVTSTRLRTYTFIVTRVAGTEQVVTSTTEVKPHVTTVTITLPADTAATTQAAAPPPTPALPEGEGRAMVAAEAVDEGRRINVATRVMSNGVEVIVAGAKQTPAPAASPTTLPPTTLSEHVILRLPQDDGEDDEGGAEVTPTLPPTGGGGVFVTKTYLTTYTYLTTLLSGGSTVVTSSERVVSNVATEYAERPPAVEDESPTAAQGVTVDGAAQAPLSTGVLLTTYSYQLQGGEGGPWRSQQTVTNTLTATTEAFAPQPARTSTYVSTLVQPTTLPGGQVLSAGDLLTRVVVSEAGAAAPPSQPQPSTTEVVKTYLATYLYVRTLVDERGSPSLSTQVVTSTEVVTDRFYLPATKRPQPAAATSAPPQKTQPPAPPPVQPTTTPAADEAPVTATAQAAAPFLVFATKTYLTTFTYLTTLLQAAPGDRTSTVVNSHTKVVQNIVTETIPPSLLGAEQLDALRSSLQATATATAAPAVAMATLPGGQQVQVVAMQAPELRPTSTAPPAAAATTTTASLPVELAPSMDTLQPANVENIVTGSTIIFFDDDDVGAVATPALDTQTTSASAAALSDSRSSVVNEGAATVFFPEPDPTAAGGGDDGAQDSSTVAPGDDDPAAPDVSEEGEEGATSVVTVTASPVTTTVAVQVTKQPQQGATVGPGGSEIQVSDLLSLGSLGINGLNALGPVFNAMAGLIQSNLQPQQQEQLAKRRNDSVVGNTRLPEQPPAEQPHPVYRPQAPQRSPIYIPVGGLAADSDMDAAESQNYEARIKVNALPGGGKWSGPSDAPGGVVIGRPTLEKPLGDGIPISPGEVITANSDVIIGKPAVMGPRPPKIAGQGQGDPVGMRPPPPQQTPWLQHHPPRRDEFLGPPPPPPPPPGSQLGGEPLSRPPGSSHHYRLNHEHPFGGLNLKHNQKPAALKLRPIIEDGSPYKVVTGSQAVLVAEGGAGEVVRGSPAVPHRHALLPGSGASLLVDIQPSQVANVLIPRGSASAHVYSAPAPAPDAFVDNSPFPVPEASPDFVGLDAAPQLEHGVGTVIEVHSGDGAAEAPAGVGVGGAQGGDISVNIAPGQGISVDVGPGGPVVHARPDGAAEAHRIQPSGVVLDAPRPAQPLHHPPPPPPSQQQQPVRRPPVTLYRPSAGPARPQQHRFPTPLRPLAPADFMTPPPPPSQLPSRPPAPPPTPGSAHHVHHHQHGGPLVIPLRPEAEQPPASGHNVHVHDHAHDHVHDHDLHIHGVDHELTIHDHGPEPVRTGGSGIVVRPGPGPVEVFVRPDGELVSAKDDLGAAGSSRPLPRPPPPTSLITLWPGNRYNASRPQLGARPAPRPASRPRPGDLPSRQPPLQHGFHEVHLLPTHQDGLTGPVGGQREPPPAFHDLPHRQRPLAPSHDNNVIVGHGPFLEEAHGAAPQEHLHSSLAGVKAPTNKVDDGPAEAHRQPGVGVGVSPGARPSHGGVRFPTGDSDAPLHADSDKPDNDGAASGTDGSPDPPTHESDDDLDEPEGNVHRGTQTERPLVVLPPGDKFNYHLDHQGDRGTQIPSNKDETPSRNEIPQFGVHPERPPGGSGWHTVDSDNEHVYITHNLPTKDDTAGIDNVPSRQPPQIIAGHRPPSWQSGGLAHIEEDSVPGKEQPSGDDLDIYYGRPQIGVDRPLEGGRPQWPDGGLRPPVETALVGNRQPPVGTAEGGFGEAVPPFKAIAEDVSAVVDSVLRPPSLNLPPATAVRPPQPPPPPPPPPRVTVLTDHQHNNKPHRQPGAPIIVLGRPAERPGEVATHRPTKQPPAVDEGRPVAADSGQGAPPDMLEVDKPPPPPPGSYDLEAHASTARPFQVRPPADAVLGMAPPPPRVTVVGAGGRQPAPEGDSTHRPVLIGGGRKPPPPPLLPPPPSEFERPPPPAPTTPRRPPFVVTPPTPSYSPARPTPSEDADDRLEDEDQELAETSSGSKPPPPPVLPPTLIADGPPAVVEVTFKSPVYTTQRPRPVKPTDSSRRPPTTTEGSDAVVTPSRVAAAPEADLLETVSVGRPVSQPLPPPPPKPNVAPTPVREPASTKVKTTESSAAAPTTADRTWTVALEGSQTRLADREQPPATPTSAVGAATTATASASKATTVVVTSGSRTLLLVKPTAARVPTTPHASRTSPPPRRPASSTSTGGLFDDFDDDEIAEEDAGPGVGSSGPKVDLGVASSNQERVVLDSSAAPPPTHYVTHTRTHTVTATETQVVSAAGRPPETRTVVITRTLTSSLVGTVTETHTLLRPTSVYATVTTTVSATKTIAAGTLPSTSTTQTVAAPSAPTTDAAPPAAATSPPPPPPPPASPGAGESGEAAEKPAGAGDADTFFVVVTDPHSKLPPPSGAPLPPGIIEYEVDKEDEEQSSSAGAGADGDAAHVLVTAGVGGAPASASASPCRPECSAARNEVCQRAPGGRARCLCRPGFARIFPDRPCKPTYTYTLRLVLSRRADRPLSFSPALGDTGSDVFGDTSRAAAAGLDRLVMQSDLRDVFHGVSVEGFLPPDGDDGGSAAGIIVTFQVRLSDNTDEERLKEVFRKSLRATNYSLGGTDVYADKERIQHIEAEDFDECASRQFHDCSENAHCFNLRGTYTCSCREGFADLSENPHFPGRLCSAELIGCERCHYHGTCHARGDDQVQCECFQWYAGDTCQINLKALLIALVTMGCALVALLLICVLVTCARRPAGRGRGRRRRDGTLDRRAMIHDSASEASADNAPVACATQTPVAMFGKKPRPAPVPTVVAVVPPPAPTGFAPPPPLADQRDRSLTVMIPRAKYRPSPMAHTQPHQPLPTLVSMSTFGDAEKRAIAHESKLLALLEGTNKQDVQHQHHHHHHQQQQQQLSSKRKPSNTASQVTESSTPRKTSSPRKPSTGNPPAPGALVSAGFEVSATVGKPTPDSDTETSAVVHNGSTLRTTDSVQINIEEMSEPSIKAGSAVETLTVSEARSCDETTIHPPTKSLHSNYSSKQSSNNLNNDEGHTMAERDVGSTFVMPQSHLYTPDRGSDISNFDSL